MRMREDMTICLSLAIISMVCALVFVIFAISTGCSRSVAPANCDSGRVHVQWVTANWCGPCKQQEPHIQEILGEIWSREVWCSRYDISECPPSIGAKVVPTYIVTVGDEEIGRAHNPHELRELLGGLK